MKWLNSNKLITIDSNNKLKLINYDDKVLSSVDELSLSEDQSSS